MSKTIEYQTVPVHKVEIIKICKFQVNSLNDTALKVRIRSAAEKEEEEKKKSEEKVKKEDEKKKEVEKVEKTTVAPSTTVPVSNHLDLHIKLEIHNEYYILIESTTICR